MYKTASGKAFCKYKSKNTFKNDTEYKLINSNLILYREKKIEKTKTLHFKIFRYLQISENHLDKLKTNVKKKFLELIPNFRFIFKFNDIRAK